MQVVHVEGRAERQFGCDIVALAAASHIKTLVFQELLELAGIYLGPSLKLINAAIIFGHDVIDIRKGLAGGHLQDLFCLTSFRRGRGGFDE